MFTVFDTPSIRKERVANFLKEPINGVKELDGAIFPKIKDFVDKGVGIAANATRASIFTRSVLLLDDDASITFSFVSAESIIRKAIQDETWKSRDFISDLFEPLLEATILERDEFVRFAYFSGAIMATRDSSKSPIDFALPLLEEAEMRGRTKIGSFYANVIAPRTSDVATEDYIEWYKERAAKIERVARAVKISDARLGPLMAARPIGVGKPSMRSISRDLTLGIKSNLFPNVKNRPIDIFSTASPSADVPFIYLIESPVTIAARSWFEPSVEFLTTYFTTALSSASTGTGMIPRSVVRGAQMFGKGPVKVFDCIRLREMLPTDFTKIIPSSGSIARAPPDTFILSVRTDVETYLTAFLFPDSRESTYTLHLDTDIIDDEVIEKINESVITTFKDALEISSDTAVSNIRGTMIMPDATSFSPQSFYFNVITNPFFNNVVYIDETTISFGERSLSPSFVLGSVFSAALSPVDLISGRKFPEMSFRFEFSKAAGTMPISFTSKTEKAVPVLRECISRILGLYVESFASNTVAFLQKILPGSTPTIGERRTPSGDEEEARPAGSTSPTKIKDLRLLSRPGSFSANYVTDCSCLKQPVIISPDEVAEWNASGRKAIEYNGRLFVCPSKKTPMPAITVSKGKGAEGGSYPCCFQNEKRAKTAERRLEGEEKAAKVRPDYPITRNKPAEPTRFGIVPYSFLHLIKVAFMQRQINYNIMRFGNKLKTPNSMLHAILTGLTLSKNALILEGDKKLDKIGKRPLYFSRYDDYPAHTDPVGQEAYAESIRSELLKVNAGVYAQEFPREYWTARTLSESVTDSLANGKYIDSALHYRGIEEMMNVNIVVMLPDHHEENGDYMIEIPRSTPAHFPRAVKTSRPTLILLRLDGFGPYPHYEVIGSRGILLENETSGRIPRVTQTDAFALFPMEVAMILKSLLINSHELIRFSDKDRVLRLYSLSASFSWKDLERPGVVFVSGGLLKSQIVDSYGKMQGAVIAVPGFGSDILVLGSPAAPLNLPISDVIDDRLFQDSEDAYIPTSLFSKKCKVEQHNPHAVVKIDELSFKVIKMDFSKPRMDNKSPFEVWMSRRRSAHLLVQFLNWARVVERVQAALAGVKPRPLDEWWKDSTTSGDGGELHPPPYIPFAFPDIKMSSVRNDLNLPFKTLSHIWPAAFRSDMSGSGHVRLSFGKESLREKLFGFIKDVEMETLGVELDLANPEMAIPRFILGMHSRKSDLAFDKKSLVFLSSRQLFDWILFLRGGNVSVVHPSGSDRITPAGIFTDAGGIVPFSTLNSPSIGVEIDSKRVALIENVKIDKGEQTTARITPDRIIQLDDSTAKTALLSYGPSSTIAGKMRIFTQEKNNTFLA
jgi:hypothetical protein